MNNENVSRLSLINQSDFPFEKLKAEIDLPVKGLIWPSVKDKLLIHKEANGGSIYNSLRWAARYGIDRLLQNSGIRACDDMRIHAESELGITSLALAHLIVRFARPIAECMEVNACNQARALEILLGNGVEFSKGNGYTPVTESIEVTQKRA